MRAILISVQPQWVKLILSLIKKDEIRKGAALFKAINRLIKEQGVAPMLIYCTKGKDKKDSLVYVKHDLFDDSVVEFALNGRVVARFNATADLLELKMIEGGLFFAKPDKEVIELDLNENAQIDNWQLLRYTGEKLGTQISDIHVNDLKVFDIPKLLTDFNRVKWDKCGVMDKNGLYQCHKCPYAIHYGHGFGDCGYDKPIKAPQSWMYVEIEE